MFLALLLAQVTPVQPMPKGTALPPPGAEEAAVLAPITRMFAALATGDGAAMLASARPEGRATGVDERADGTRTVRSSSMAEFTGRFSTDGPKLEERLVGAPAIEIDGDIAMVWSPYIFLIDGKLSHCGTNHFDMLREGGAWKVLNVTWTQRKTDCPAA